MLKAPLRSRMDLRRSATERNTLAERVLAYARREFDAYSGIHWFAQMSKRVIAVVRARVQVQQLYRTTAAV